jgi:hypothetical protein
MPAVANLKGERRNMAATKYGKYIALEPYRKPSNEAMVVQPLVYLQGNIHGGGANITIRRSWITQPFTMIKAAHAHEQAQFLFFAGGNPLNVKDFGAEIELYLGQEGEKHVITTPAVVHIPPGLLHGPLIYTRIDRPIEFLDIYLAPEYIRK